MLVNDLDYRGPEVLLKAVLAARHAAKLPSHFERAIDLGCGTGLVAREFASLVNEFVGVDLSSGMIVMMTLLGGASSFFGPFIGALVFLVMEDVLSLWTSHWQIIVGSVFVLFVLFLPKGIWGTFLTKVMR